MAGNGPALTGCQLVSSYAVQHMYCGMVLQSPACFAASSCWLKACPQTAGTLYHSLCLSIAASGSLSFNCHQGAS